MELGLSEASLPPFWAAVRRRHPEVDLVLLPDESPPATEAAPLLPGTLDAALDRVTAYATGVWALAAGSDEPVPTRFRFGPREDTVAAQARISAVVGGTPLAGLDPVLDRAGWSIARPAGAVERLIARRGGLELVASYAEATGVLAVSVTSAPMPVGVTRARELVRA